MSFSEQLKLYDWTLTSISLKIAQYDKTLPHNDKYLFGYIENKLHMLSFSTGQILFDCVFNGNVIDIFISGDFLALLTKMKLYVYKINVGVLTLINTHEISKYTCLLHNLQFIFNGNTIISVSDDIIMFNDIQEHLNICTKKIEYTGAQNYFGYGRSVKINETTVLFYTNVYDPYYSTQFHIITFDDCISNNFTIKHNCISNKYIVGSSDIAHTDKYIYINLTSDVIVLDHNLNVVTYLNTGPSVLRIFLCFSHMLCAYKQSLYFYDLYKSNEFVGNSSYVTLITNLYISDNKIIFNENECLTVYYNYKNIFKTIIWKAKLNKHKLINLLPCEILSIIQQMCSGSNYII